MLLQKIGGKEKEFTGVIHTETEEELKITTESGANLATPTGKYLGEEQVTTESLTNFFKEVEELTEGEIARYKHYKGGIYIVLFHVTYQPTGEHLVVYKDENNKIWARPRKMFHGKIEVKGKVVNRFERF